MIAKAQEYINQHSLNTANRRRALNYKRIIISKMLRDNGLTYFEIGTMMNKHHSTVVHMIKNYHLFIQYKDFQEVDREIRLTLQGKTLKDKVLECNDYWEMVKLQKELLSLQPSDV